MNIYSYLYICIEAHLFPHIYTYIGVARCVMVIVVGNGHCDTSSNPGPD